MAACKWCGTENAEGVVTCANCGQSLAADSTFDPQAFAGAMSDKVDRQIAAQTAASIPPSPEPPAPVAVVPVATPPQYAPPPQYAAPPQFAPPPQQYAAPPQYAPPPQQYAAPPQYAPPPQQHIPPGYAAAPMQPPKSGLGNAIAVTILCCMPLGIVAIVFATQVDKKWAMGDYAGAQHAAKMANLWATIGAVVGIIWIIISCIIGFASSQGTTTNYYPY